MESSSSDSDRDEGFEADMEALRRACLRNGANAADAADVGSDSDAYSDPESSGSDDIGLLCRLKERFSSPLPSTHLPPFIKPLNILLPDGLGGGDDDNDDDLETLRAIQRRFAQYKSDSLEGKPEKCLEEVESISTDVISGPETPNRSMEFFKEHGHNDTQLKPVNYEACNSNVRSFGPSMFPQSVQNFVVALKRNRLYQKFIRRKLIEIEANIEKNKELKKRVKCLMDFQTTCKRKVTMTTCQKKDPRVVLISAKKTMPDKSSKAMLKKVPALCFGPDENSHVSTYRMVLERFPVSLNKRPWSKIEKDNLAKGIKQQYQEMLLLNSMNMESDKECTSDSNLMSAVTLSHLEFTPEMCRSFIPMVNWDRLASMYILGRSGAECEARWLNCEDSMINHEPWTAEEDKKLLFILQERGIYNWIEISITLGTHRTPFQCLVRYQRSLNPHILNKDWTEEEDAQLRAAVENYGENNWQIVASCLEGRLGNQCSNRWSRTVNPARKKVGRWSVDEDKLLKVAVKLFGAKNWVKIAQFIPGRTQIQCRERWLNCLDPSLNLQPWTAEEDIKLLDAVAIHGNCWSKIATCIPPRTDNQCRRRWKILCPEELLMLQSATQIKKSALISNFVSRERERPAIGTKDFTSVLGSTMVQKIAGPKVRKRKLRDDQPKKLTTRTRKVKGNSEKVNFINRDNIPRKSRSKSIRHCKDNATEDCMRNTTANILPENAETVIVVSLTAGQGMCLEKTMDKSLSENPRTSNINSKVSALANSTPDGTSNPSVDAAPDENQSTSIINSKVPALANSAADKRFNSLADEAANDLPLVLCLNATSSVDTKRKRKKASENLYTSRINSRSPSIESLTDCIANSSVDIRRKITSNGNITRSSKASTNLLHISQVQKSCEENVVELGVPNTSELVPPDLHSFGANSNTSIPECVSWPTKKRKRSKPQGALARVSDDNNLLASGVDTSVVRDTERAMSMGSSLKGPAEDGQMQNSHELCQETNTQSEEANRPTIYNDSNDYLFLSTFCNMEKGKLGCTIKTKSAQTANSTIIQSTDVSIDGVGDVSPAMLHGSAKGKQSRILTEEETRTNADSSKQGALPDTNVQDDDCYLSTFYERVKRHHRDKSRKITIWEEVN
ncbi:uncharacterized protein LOC121969347 isoform X2 [Zingiber officinale]|uniref:uncharacterized protein LOC121969347 isoform X2 n=1 Tax=Zingiber officinale TaxID=94328 RepID=UPI001C4B25A3|nr:uncharacterized protein LOC121969347 isoform X2 [Zingiber officinale]